jgi:hypothetical protein
MNIKVGRNIFRKCVCRNLHHVYKTSRSVNYTLCKQSVIRYHGRDYPVLLFIRRFRMICTLDRVMLNSYSYRHFYITEVQYRWYQNWPLSTILNFFHNLVKTQLNNYPSYHVFSPPSTTRIRTNMPLSPNQSTMLHAYEVKFLAL